MEKHFDALEDKVRTHSRDLFYCRFALPKTRDIRVYFLLQANILYYYYIHPRAPHVHFFIINSSLLFNYINPFIFYNSCAT